MTVRTLLQEIGISGSERWRHSFLRLDSNFNERRNLKGETWLVNRTSIVYFFSLNSLRKSVKHKWRQLKVSWILSIIQFLDKRTGSIAGMQT